MPYDEETFKNWIVQAESSWHKAESEYDKARNYYEDEQAPSVAPSKKEYVQENLITDTIDRAVGQVTSGKIKTTLKGGGEAVEPVKELHDEILSDNDFNTKIVPRNMNHFYCEGLGGIKWVEEPKAKGRFGVGRGRVYYLQPGELWLDPNSKDGMHDDDFFRIHPKRMLLTDAQEKFGRNEKGNKTKLWNEIVDSRDDESGTETEPHVYLYEIEYRVKSYTLKTTAKGVSYREEEDVYYICKVINKTLIVQPPQKTGYPCFRLIPIIHTPRQNVTCGRYPMGLYKKLGQSQDNLNVNDSVMLEAVKASIKQFVTVTGGKEDEAELARKQLAKTNGLAYFKSPNTKVNVYPGTPLPPSLLQYREQTRERFDNIRGSSSSAQQFQSASAGQLSGKAIGSLQFAGIMPEHAKTPHIQQAYKDLSRCIIHYIKTRMKQPFSIDRKIDGTDRKINFNKTSEPGYMGDELNIITNGTINDIDTIGNVDVDLVVEMNMQQKEEIDLNKALVALQMQKISDKDFLKKMWPYEWIEMYDNLIAQGGAAALMEKLNEVSKNDPELAQAIMTNIDQFIENYAKFEQQA
jgi:hypothetical protein